MYKESIIISFCVFLSCDDIKVLTSLLNSIASKERQIHLITTKRDKVYDNLNISRKHLGNINFTYADGSTTFESENTINFEKKYLRTGKSKKNIRGSQRAWYAGSEGSAGAA